MATIRTAITATLAVLALAGCPEAPSPAPSDAGPGRAASTADAAVRPTGATATTPTDVSPRDAAPRKHPEVRAMQFASDVKNKEPADKLSAARPGKRVYAHLVVRNRTPAPRTLTVTFTVDGVVRSTTDLEVERSWSYRTWAYVTLKPTDAGKLAVEVKDDLGERVAGAEIPIKGGP